MSDYPGNFALWAFNADLHALGAFTHTLDHDLDWQAATLAAGADNDPLQPSGKSLVHIRTPQQQIIQRRSVAGPSWHSTDSEEYDTTENRYPPSSPMSPRKRCGNMYSSHLLRRQRLGMSVGLNGAFVAHNNGGNKIATNVARPKTTYQPKIQFERSWSDVRHDHAHSRPSLNFCPVDLLISNRKHMIPYDDAEVDAESYAHTFLPMQCSKRSLSDRPVHRIGQPCGVRGNRRRRWEAVRPPSGRWAVEKPWRSETPSAIMTSVMFRTPRTSC